jgi:hypothetical protein
MGSSYKAPLSKEDALITVDFLRELPGTVTRFTAAVVHQAEISSFQSLSSLCFSVVPELPSSTFASTLICSEHGVNHSLRIFFSCLTSKQITGMHSSEQTGQQSKTKREFADKSNVRSLTS